MFAVLLILGVSLLVLWTLQDNFFPRKKYPPGPFRLPFLGNLLMFLKDRRNPPFIKYQDLAKTYGPVSYVRLGIQEALIVDDFDTAKTLLNDEIWIDRPFNSFTAKRSYGKALGIIYSSGDSWREMKRFSMRTLKNFGFGRQRDMQNSMDDELKHLIEKLDDIASKDEPILNVKHLFTMHVLNILWSMVSSVEEDEEKIKRLIIIVDNLSKATSIGGNILNIYPSLAYIFPDLTGANFMCKCMTDIQQYFEEVLYTRRADGVSKEDNRDFIDMFIKEIDRHKQLKTNPNFYTDEEFVTTLTDLFEAGSETSSNTLEFAMYHAIKNPSVQKKVQEEIDRVVGRSRLPTIADRPNMPYAEATLIEVQRIANVLPLAVRSPTEICTVNGYHVEKDTFGIVNIYSIHMDKGFWGDPFVFRPERFLDANNQIILQKANRVIPFGAGKRVCIGEQMARTTMFTFFTSLLQSFNFEDILLEGNDRGKLIHEHENPEHVMFQEVVHVGFTLSPRPYQARITKRQ